ncbi:MAG TPA: TRAP transporter TatT component family protein [Gemmatimonadales bacterium]
MTRSRIGVLPALAAALLFAGCSIKKMAVNKIGDSMAASGTTFASDEDVELIGDAVPFSLKLMESLLEVNPRHRGLLFATASGFTQYAYAYVQQEADRLESEDLTRANAARDRARRMYLRARGYGIRGLETRHRSFGDSLRANPRSAVQVAAVRDVPLLYWTAAAWGAAISLAKDNPDLVADQPQVEALIDRALELDEAFDAGAIHSFLISYEPSRQGAAGDPGARSRAHFDRAVALTNGQMAGPFVSLAEAVSVPAQDRKEFASLLQRALAIDPDARTEWRLANLIMQRRARWLLSRADELFLDGPMDAGYQGSLGIPLGPDFGR